MPGDGCSSCGLILSVAGGERSLDGRCEYFYSACPARAMVRVVGVRRALDALTLAAYVTLIVGVDEAHRPLETMVLGGFYVLVATVGFGWVIRRARRGTSIHYVLAQLVLGYAV